MRALAVTTAKRTASLPDVPTIGESVPGFQINTWQGIGAPKNTSAEIVAMLNKEINAALANEKIKARLAQIGSEPNPMSPTDSRSSSSTKRQNGQSHPRSQDTAAVKLDGLLRSSR